MTVNTLERMMHKLKDHLFTSMRHKGENMFLVLLLLIWSRVYWIISNRDRNLICFVLTI